MAQLTNIRCFSATTADAHQKAKVVFASAFEKSKLVQKLVELGKSQYGKSTGTEENACMFVIKNDSRANKICFRYFTVLERRRRTGFHVWGIPGGGREIDTTGMLESCWDCAQREFQEEVGVQFPPTQSTASTDRISFEFSKFTIGNTRYYCWFTNEFLYKGHVTNSKNGEILFADWARDDALLASIANNATPLDIMPRDMNGKSITLPKGATDKYRIRGCFSETFNSFFR